MGDTLIKRGCHGKLFTRQQIRGNLKGAIRYYKDAECFILHREDGPAVDVNHEVYDRYFLDGKEYNKTEWMLRVGGLSNAEDIKQATDILDI